MIFCGPSKVAVLAAGGARSHGIALNSLRMLQIVILLL
jgi:hypothetical protein